MSSDAFESKAFIGNLRAEHNKEIRELESRRLDAIRQVDVTAVKTEADRALAAIQTLAATTATNAENLRNAVAASAATLAKQNSDNNSQLIERIAALEKSAYEGKGKQAYADPMLSDMMSKVNVLLESRADSHGKQAVTDPLLAELAAEVKVLRATGHVDAGKSNGISATWAVLIGVVSLIGTILVIATFFRTPPTVISPAPIEQKK